MCGGVWSSADLCSGSINWDEGVDLLSPSCCFLSLLLRHHNPFLSPLFQEVLDYEDLLQHFGLFLKMTIRILMPLGNQI